MRRGTTLLAVACLAALMLAVASAQAATSCQQMRSWVRSGGSASGLLVVDTEGRLCGVVAQADVALSGRDRKTAELLRGVSEPKH